MIVGDGAASWRLRSSSEDLSDEAAAALALAASDTPGSEEPSVPLDGRGCGAVALDGTGRLSITWFAISIISGIWSVVKASGRILFANGANTERSAFFHSRVACARVPFSQLFLSVRVSPVCSHLYLLSSTMRWYTTARQSGVRCLAPTKAVIAANAATSTSLMVQMSVLV